MGEAFESGKFCNTGVICDAFLWRVWNGFIVYKGAIGLRNCDTGDF